MNRTSFKQYLTEKFKYPNSFSDVLDSDDKEDEELTKVDSPSGSIRDAQKNKRDCEELERGDGEQDYNPCKLLQLLQISNAGDE